MKILFLEEQPCIRALKYAVGLKRCYSDIQLYFGYCGKSLTEFYGFGDEYFDGWFKLIGRTDKSINYIIKNTIPDLIHCHNAPDTLTVSTLEFFKGQIPIIHDVHDLMSLRKTIYDDGIQREETLFEKKLTEERIALEHSDAIITVSEALFDAAYEKYNLGDKRHLIFPNLIVEEMIPIDLKEKLSNRDQQIHIVYEGHLDETGKEGHYDLHNIFREIAAQSIHLHIYPSKQNRLCQKLNEENGFIHYHTSLETKKLMQELTQYDFGWSGFNTSKNKDHVDTVLANKTIEYISAGLPVISFPHKSQKKFIQKYGVGVVIENFNNLSRN
ncbi:unnamed protein product, partial [marine sediment metagenome]